MRHIAPEGERTRAGTLSGNPVAMAAGERQLSERLKPDSTKTGAAYRSVHGAVQPCSAAAQRIPFKVFRCGSIFWFRLFRRLEAIRRSDEIDPVSMNHFRAHAALLETGVTLGPSGYEVDSSRPAHTDAVCWTKPQGHHRSCAQRDLPALSGRLSSSKPQKKFLSRLLPAFDRVRRAMRSSPFSLF